MTVLLRMSIRVAALIGFMDDSETEFVEHPRVRVIDDRLAVGSARPSQSKVMTSTDFDGAPSGARGTKPDGFRRARAGAAETTGPHTARFIR
jgi:hypothetical protein